MDQPGKVANPAHGQLNRGYLYISLSPFAPEDLVTRDGFGRPVPRQHSASACSFSTLRLNLVLTHGIPPASLCFQKIIQVVYLYLYS